MKGEAMSNSLAMTMPLHPRGLRAALFAEASTVALEGILRRWDQMNADVTAAMKKAGASDDEIRARLTEVEQHLAQRREFRGYRDEHHETPGSRVIASADFKSFGGSRRRGKLTI